ncbi:hypothetical protein GSI_12350 [Ganoderma sinense ZZ0214-1]|uniref:Alcohol dehydrogenase-like N-terminal domain-containing protein n=1 Tax=Ganoderma sinense ZZ0214-1 TaxID=1077348 RepID=A0A2G8RYK1_9APHY|nr:hypothetical protein GSI_12350 [Ganoderma sinense ZZ0214-1]
MALPYTLTPGFIEAVDNLIQDTAVPDSALHSRSKQYLDIFDDATVVRPVWSQRIRVPSPFTTPGLFNAMFQIADELGLAAGKRYVSAAICVCAEHAARAHAAAGADSELRGALVRALHQLSSTWAAFLLWPFYAHGEEECFRNDGRRDMPPPSGDETPTAKSIARAQRRRLKALVMARDNSCCFLSSGLDNSVYSRGMSLPPGVTRVAFCCTVSIIPREVLAQPAADASEDRSGIQPMSDQDITSGILQRFCGVQDAATLVEQAQGPANTLLVHEWGALSFSMFLWWLLPTETPDHYEIKNPNPIYNIGNGIPPPSHVTFADHSPSAMGSVELPAPALLRAHAALGEVLHRSGALATFQTLRHSSPEPFPNSLCPAGTGSAFWRSVVEYEGPEPDPTNVLIKLVSVALNLVDAFVQAQGIPGLVPGYPSIPVFDGAGIVEEVGAEVTNVAKDDKVHCLHWLVQGTFDVDNRHSTFQEYTLQPAKYVEKAATVSLCLATVVNGIRGHEESSNSARFTPPWEEGSTTKHAGQAALILGGGTNVGQYGFSPIITTASPKNTSLLRSLGAAHVLDRALSPDTLRAALSESTTVTAAAAAPITYVYDAFGHSCDAQLLGYSVLAPGGA